MTYFYLPTDTVGDAVAERDGDGSFHIQLRQLWQHGGDVHRQHGDVVGVRRLGHGQAARCGWYGELRPAGDAASGRRDADRPSLLRFGLGRVPGQGVGHRWRVAAAPDALEPDGPTGKFAPGAGADGVRVWVEGVQRLRIVQQSNGRVGGCVGT